MAELPKLVCPRPNHDNHCSFGYTGLKCPTLPASSRPSTTATRTRPRSFCRSYTTNCANSQLSARRQHSLKRGGRRQQVCLEDAPALSEQPADDLLALDEALTQLAEEDPVK